MKWGNSARGNSGDSWQKQMCLKTETVRHSALFFLRESGRSPHCEPFLVFPVAGAKPACGAGAGWRTGGPGGGRCAPTPSAPAPLPPPRPPSTPRPNEWLAGPAAPRWRAAALHCPPPRAPRLPPGPTVPWARVTFFGRIAAGGREEVAGAGCPPPAEPALWDLRVGGGGAYRRAVAEPWTCEKSRVFLCELTFDSKGL